LDFNFIKSFNLQKEASRFFGSFQSPHRGDALT